MKRVYSQPFVIVRAFIQKGGKFLLIQEAWGEVKGLWNFPAGWLDVGEDPLTAVKRETKEETGYDFTPTSLLGIYSYTKSEGGQIKHALDLVFRGEISGAQDTVDVTEVSQMRWFSPEEIYEMDSSKLRDKVTKQMTKDYLSGQEYPLDLLTHLVTRK